MIAFFFLIGILGTIKNIDTVSFKPYLHSMQQEGMTQTEDTRDDWLLPVCSLQKIDDFQQMQWSAGSIQKQPKRYVRQRLYLP